MLTNVDQDVELIESANYYSMTFWIRYDDTDDNYFLNLMYFLREMERRVEYKFMQKLGLDRYNRIIEHNKGHGPVRMLFTTSRREIKITVELEHCGCGEEGEHDKKCFRCGNIGVVVGPKDRMVCEKCFRKAFPIYDPNNYPKVDEIKRESILKKPKKEPNLKDVKTREWKKYGKREDV